eukprot:c15763_g1_i1.p1 GENE.c15763_g1_i1~~c15763_g1_i1.p1  ORF type:complete len:524 (+),score=158.55 c15763_g1_i1:218-1573(+)
MFKEVMADILQMEKKELFLLTVKSGEGTVMLTLRLVVPTDVAEEKTELLNSSVEEGLIAASLTQREYKTSSVYLAAKLHATAIEASTTVPEPVEESKDDEVDKSIMLQQMRMQQAQQGAGSDIKDARLELRLRNLERESKELRQLATQQREKNDKMQAEIEAMKSQMVKQMSLIKKMAADGTRQRSGTTAAAPAGLSRSTSRSIVPSGSSDVRQQAAAAVAAVEEGERQGALKQSQSAFDILSGLRTAKKPPTPVKVTANEIPPMNVAAIKKLQTSVQRLKAHFNQPMQGTVSKHSLGNDSANKEIGRLVRGELCTALAMVFLNGFKSFKFVGRYHIWDFLEKCSEFNGAADKAKQSIADGVGAVRALDEYMKGKNDLKFRALICYALNHHVLHQWVRALESEDPLVQKWFENWAFLRNDKAREMIINALTPLAEDPYELALDYELAMWDL